MLITFWNSSSLKTNIIHLEMHLPNTQFFPTLKPVMCQMLTLFLRVCSMQHSWTCKFKSLFCSESPNLNLQELKNQSCTHSSGWGCISECAVIIYAYRYMFTLNSDFRMCCKHISFKCYELKTCV